MDDVSNAKQWEVTHDTDKGNKNEKDESLFNWGNKGLFFNKEKESSW